MTTPTLESFYLQALSSVLTPLAESGALSPGVLPAGLIVLESVGWRSGLPRRTTLAAAALGDCLFVSTVRGRRSHWVRNLIERPDVRYWRGDRPRDARAFVAAPAGVAGPGRPDAAGDLPAAVSLIWPGLVSWADVSGCAYIALAARG